jgi:hypothetical protein
MQKEMPSLMPIDQRYDREDYLKDYVQPMCLSLEAAMKRHTLHACDKVRSVH